MKEKKVYWEFHISEELKKRRLKMKEKKVYWGFYISKELKDMAVKAAGEIYKSNSEFLRDAIYEHVKKQYINDVKERGIN